MAREGLVPALRRDEALTNGVLDHLGPVDIAAAGPADHVLYGGNVGEIVIPAWSGPHCVRLICPCYGRSGNIDCDPANGVDIKKTQLTLGPVLRMDSKKEQFLDNPKANALLTRNYRAPFVVPEKV